MKVLYARIGWMNSYNGILTEEPKHGGSYNLNNIGHEVYNFTSYNNKYYGFVQPVNCTINVDKLCIEKNQEFANDILVIWVATRDNYGQVIVGWYKNATVYRNFQRVSEDVLRLRHDEYFYDYNIFSENATLILPVEKRTFKIKGIGQSCVWYGNPDIDKEVIEYINNYEKNNDEIIKKVSQNIEHLEGYEKEAIVKARVNQSIFRDLMLKKYNCCCLCGIKNKDMLVASHIKPWSKSEKNEKLNEYNGLLLCAMHDKLFDLGYISFTDSGNIIISNELDKTDRILSNINENKKILITSDNIKFIQYHRNNIFRGNEDNK